MAIKKYIQVALWSTVFGAWTTSSVISFKYGKNSINYLFPKVKKCWYDGSQKTFKEELIKESQKLKKFEEKLKTTKNKDFLKNQASQANEVSQDDSQKVQTPHEKLTLFINSEIEKYCKKRFDTLMEKLEGVFSYEGHGEQEYDESYYEFTNDLFNKVLDRLDPRWNKYNHENYNKIWTWDDNQTGILKPEKKSEDQKQTNQIKQ